MRAEKLLIIDESPHFSQSAKRFLAGRKELGAVETALGAEEALKALTYFQPTLVVASDSLLKSSEPLLAAILKLSKTVPGLKLVRLVLFTKRFNEETFAGGEPADDVVAKDDFAAGILNLLNKIRRDESEFKG